MCDPIRSADCVLFDFDGPICRLFAGRPAPLIAENLRSLIREQGGQEELLRRVEHTGDPLAVLRAAEPHSALAAMLEKALTEEELRAAESAEPTPHAGDLARSLVAAGRRVAVTTNNSASAAERYLTRHGLLPLFAGHVHGRRDDAGLLKPHPDCLLRALASTRTPADRALMIGDTVHDLRAAEAARVAFLGFSPRPARRAELRSAGADHAVGDLGDVVSAFEQRPQG
jgi:phosphoglycolate phosphatase